MLTRIEISSFGRFRNASFDLHKNTVFFGPNESGKTTLFDALALELCETSRREQKPISDIKKRYINGSENRAHIKIEPTNHPRLSPGLFFNFFAIRSSDVIVQFNSEKNWVTEMRAKLLFGGYDLTAIKDIFSNLSTSRRSQSYPSRLNEVEKKMQEIDAKIYSLELSKYNTLYTTLQETQKELKECESELARIKTELQELRKEQETYDIAAQSLNFSHWEKLYNKYETLRREIQQQYSGINETEVQELEQTQDNLSQQGESVRQRLEQLKREEENLRVLYETICGIDEEITHEHHVMTRRIRFLTTMGVVFSVIGGIGIGTSLFLSAPLPFVIGASVVFVAGLGLFLSRFFFKKSTSLLHLESQMRMLYQQALQGRYVTSYPKNWESFRLALEESYQKSKQNLQDMEAAYKRYEDELEKFKKRLENFYMSSSVASLKAAQEILHQRRQKESELQATIQALEAHPFRQKDLSLEENHTYNLKRYQNLNRSEGLSAQDIETKKQEVKRKIDTLEQKQQTLSQKREALFQKETQERIQLSYLERAAQEYASYKQQKWELEQEKKNLQDELEAVRHIEEILQEIDREQSNVFQTLSQSVQKEFGHIFPPFKTLVLDQLSSEDIQLQDATQTLRPLNFLSKGTQDLFYLGMRLFLGKQMWSAKTPGVFVLDEPFASLDNERIQLALAMLDEFQKKYDWQYIILTKDATLVDLIKKRWSDVLVHTLSR